MMKELCLCLQDSKKDDEVAVPACVQEHERYYPTPPHPSSNWWWKSCACVCRTARKMMRLLCLCVYRNMNVIIPPHPTPAVTDDERAVPVSAGQQERWWVCRACVCTGTWELLSHPTLPVSAGQQERWWGCLACVCTGTWTLLSHPTPPQQ